MRFRFPIASTIACPRAGSSISPALVVVCSALLGGSARAQVKLLVLHGDEVQDHFGTDVSRAGDVNGDGVPDFIAGAPWDSTLGSQSGQATVHSGLDGSVLHTFYGYGALDLFGETVGDAGDVDGDGFGDVIVGSHYESVADTTGIAQVFSGKDGATLHTFFGAPNDFGISASVAGVGDVDGDGHADVIVGESRDSTGGVEAGRVRVYSGLDGSILYERFGVPGQNLGFSVDGAGDVDMDGVPDFIAGTETPFSGLAPEAWIWSGADGSVLHTLSVGMPNNQLGLVVSAAGDVDADGHADVIVGAPGDTQHSVGSGKAIVFSGADGSTLYTHWGSANCFFGFDVSGGGDFDGDGHDDFLVGALRWPGTLSGSGVARLYSGANGGLLRVFESGLGDDAFGLAVDALGDGSGDGVVDYVIGAHLDSATGFHSGAVHVHSAVSLVSNYCTSTVNSTGAAATIRSTGYASLFADDLVLIAEHLPPNKLGIFITSQTQAQIPFGDGFRCVGTPLKRIQPVQLTSGAGTLTQPFDVTHAPWSALIQAGATWNFQGWFRDPAAGGAGFNLTDGLQVTFVP